MSDLELSYDDSGESEGNGPRDTIADSGASPISPPHAAPGRSDDREDSGSARHRKPIDFESEWKASYPRNESPVSDVSPVSATDQPQGNGLERMRHMSVQEEELTPSRDEMPLCQIETKRKSRQLEDLSRLGIKERSQRRLEDFQALAKDFQAHATMRKKRAPRAATRAGSAALPLHRHSLTQPERTASLPLPPPPPPPPPAAPAKPQALTVPQRSPSPLSDCTAPEPSRRPLTAPTREQSPQLEPLDGSKMCSSLTSSEHGMELPPPPQEESSRPGTAQPSQEIHGRNANAPAAQPPGPPLLQQKERRNQCWEAQLEPSEAPRVRTAPAPCRSVDSGTVLPPPPPPNRGRPRHAGWSRSPSEQPGIQKCWPRASAEQLPPPPPVLPMHVTGHRSSAPSLLSNSSQIAHRDPTSSSQRAAVPSDVEPRDRPSAGQRKYQLQEADGMLQRSTRGFDSSPSTDLDDTDRLQHVRQAPQQKGGGVEVRTERARGGMPRVSRWAASNDLSPNANPRESERDVPLGKGDVHTCEREVHESKHIAHSQEHNGHWIDLDARAGGQSQHSNDVDQSGRSRKRKCGHPRDRHAHSSEQNFPPRQQEGLQQTQGPLSRERELRTQQQEARSPDAEPRVRKRSRSPLSARQRFEVHQAPPGPLPGPLPGPPPIRDGKPKLWADKAPTTGGFNRWEQAQCGTDKDTEKLRRLLGVRPGPSEPAAPLADDRYTVGPREKYSHLDSSSARQFQAARQHRRGAGLR